MLVTIIDTMLSALMLIGLVASLIQCKMMGMFKDPNIAQEIFKASLKMQFIGWNKIVFSNVIGNTLFLGTLVYFGMWISIVVSTGAFLALVVAVYWPVSKPQAV